MRELRKLRGEDWGTLKLKNMKTVNLLIFSTEDEKRKMRIGELSFDFASFPKDSQEICSKAYNVVPFV